MNKLSSQLPIVRGSYQDNFPLKKITWFKLGGEATTLFKPADKNDLAYFLKNKNPDIPYFIMGAASNLLVRDGGFKGVVIKLGKGFNDFTIKENQLEVGAANLDQIVVQKLVRLGYSGLEFLCGIPGSIGGAIAMNAGCYGSEIKDHLIWAEIIDSSGKIRHVNNVEIGFSYRRCSLLSRDNVIFVKACFKIIPKDSKEVQKTIDEMLAKRMISQPTKGPTSGCTFANPDCYKEQKKAWQLIQEAGCLEDNINGAHFSKLHSNFMLRRQDTRAIDLENLGELARKKIMDKFGIDLRWEVKIVGEKQ